MIMKTAQALFVAVVLFSDLSGAHAADAETIRRAQQEKNLVVYGAPEPNFMRPLIDKFTASYPFINATYLRGGSERLVPKIQTEARAGKVLADVYCLRMAAMMVLRNEDFLTRYDSPERKFINDIHRDKEGYWTGLYTGNGLATTRSWYRPARCQESGTISSIPNGRERSAWIRLPTTSGSSASCIFWAREKGTIL